MTKIYYYSDKENHNPVKEFVDSLDKPQKAKVFRIFQSLILKNYPEPLYGK